MQQKWPQTFFSVPPSRALTVRKDAADALAAAGFAAAAVARSTHTVDAEVIGATRGGAGADAAATCGRVAALGAARAAPEGAGATPAPAPEETTAGSTALSAACLRGASSLQVGQ